MNNKKIKVFLGGYINSINAQNLNCLAIAQYIDKSKFDVGMLKLYSISQPIFAIETKVFKIRYPQKIWRYLAYFRGILWSDIAYLPKGEIYRYCKFLLKVLRRKSFITVEGVISGTNLEKMLTFCKTEDNIRDYYHYTTKTYAITEYMAKKNKELLNIKSDGVLYLGIDLNQFNARIHSKNKLTDIVFIGNNMRYKGIEDIYSLANLFPDLTFHIVGGGMGYDAPTEIRERGLQNVVYHGLMTHSQLSELLMGMDLQIFPSRSEGFPKVTLETAAAGVPSIVYSDYGASEWITSGKDGYVVNTFEEIIDIIKDLQSHPEKLPILSKNAELMAKRFDWKVLIKSWEKAIIETL